MNGSALNSRGIELKRFGFLFLLLWTVGLAPSGCDRNIAPYQPGESPQTPDLARIFPAPEVSALPEGEPARPAPAGRSGASVRGTVFAEGAAPEAPGAVLFIIARPAGAAGGPPLAVVRIPSPELPFDFEIGPKDVMIPSMTFEGPIELTARLDGDGNASTRAAGDRETVEQVAVAPGDAGVTLRLQ